MERRFQRHTQPVVNPEVRLGISQQHGARSHDASELVQGEKGQAEADIGQRNPGSLATAEYGAVWREVALAEHGVCVLLKTTSAG